MYNPWVKQYRSKRYRNDCEIYLTGIVNGVEEILHWSKLSLDAEKINASGFATYDTHAERITWFINDESDINGVVIFHKGKVVLKQAFSSTGWRCFPGDSFNVELANIDINGFVVSP